MFELVGIRRAFRNAAVAPRPACCHALLPSTPVGRRPDQGRIFNGADRQRGAERQTDFAGARNWRDDVNAKGGLLGRPVELVYYDDQSNPSTVPASTPNSSASTKSI